MSIALASKQDKAEAVDLIQRICQHFIFHGIQPSEREAVLNYFAWMRQQKGVLDVQCEFRTIPQLRRTRLTIETTIRG